jgi:hypothetical protein
MDYLYKSFTPMSRLWKVITIIFKVLVAINYNTSSDLFFYFIAQLLFLYYDAFIDDESPQTTVEQISGSPFAAPPHDVSAMMSKTHRISPLPHHHLDFSRRRSVARTSELLSGY